MEKTVKIGKREYEALKALARKRGQFLQYVLNEAVRKYVEAQRDQA